MKKNDIEKLLIKNTLKTIDIVFKEIDNSIDLDELKEWLEKEKNNLEKELMKYEEGII